MDLKDIKVFIEHKEDDNIEFKETTGQLDRGMETLCAFLNGTGGTVLFGVTDKGKIVGQEVTDKTKRSIAEAINRLEPVTAVQVAYVSINNSGKYVVSLHVEDMRFERPFSYKGRPYMRRESVTLIMPQSAYTELIFEREGMSHGWESYIDDKLKITDLDKEEILRTMRLGIDCGRQPESTERNIPDILEKLGVSENGKLKHAAFVLFANRKLADYPQCLLRLARFRGTDKTVFTDSQRVHGNIFKLLDAAMAFVFKHLSLSSTTETLEREEHLEIPYKAIREAIVNCLCHRSYREIGGSASIAIYDDRVEIYNPGSLPLGWNLEKLERSHESQPHNPIIADVLYVRKVLESWGRGIDLIRRECENVNIPTPKYIISGRDVCVVFKRTFGQVSGQVYTSNNEALTTKSDNKSGQVGGQASGQVHVSDNKVIISRQNNKGGQVNGQVAELVRKLAETTLSVNTISKLLSVSSRRKLYSSYLTPAIDLGLIAKTYPDNPNHPRQKYYLTDKGLEYLRDIEKKKHD